jgi:phospholipid/cholesterol/gamma-HCH transport system permease protein
MTETSETTMLGDLLAERRQRIEQYGDQLLFVYKALSAVPTALRHYRREIWDILAEVAFGAGALTMIAGTAGVIAFMSFFAGTEVGFLGYASLRQFGVG